MGAIRLVPSNSGTVTITSVLNPDGTAVTLYTDAARTAAVTLPATKGGSDVLYVATAVQSHQLWLRATAPGGAVVTGSGRTSRPEYDVVQIPVRDLPVVEMPLDGPDASVVASRVVYGGTP